jgi:cyclic pyranopterin phosphate synthase
MDTMPDSDPPTVLDTLNRPIKDLRISLTDRCQFRCSYCLPAEHVDVMRQHSQPEQHLSFAEITQAVAAFAQLGVNKIRLTGGEPLLRKNVSKLIKDIKSIKGIDEVALTTNAGLLDPVLDDLVDAGLDRITISIDALDQELFTQITGTKVKVHDILNSINKCLDSNLKQVKVNCVIQKGVNEDQIVPMLAHFRGTGVVVRFIEFMDVGNINGWQPSQVIESKQILKLVADRWPFKAKPASNKGEVANRFEFNDGMGEFGLISSISEPFCHDCNRARLSTQGEVYTCLFASQGHDIKAVINQADELVSTISNIWQQRKDQYSAQRKTTSKNTSPKIEMFVIGG